MSSIRPKLLEEILRQTSIGPISELLPSQTRDTPTADEPADNPELQILFEEIEGVTYRLDALSPGSFNITGLRFRNNDLPDAQNTETLNIETFLDGLLKPDDTSRRFISTIRSLQSLAHELDDLLDEARKFKNPALIRQCEDTSSNVKTELDKLIAAAREIQISQATQKGYCNASNIRSIDFSSPAYPSYQLTPIATAAIIIISLIHCFMNVSRDNCNFILRAIRGLLRLVIRMDGSQHHAFLLKNIDKIPTTLETSIHYLGIQPTFVFWAACPRCSTLYPENEPIPERCSAINPQNKLCNSSLLLGRRRGIKSWRKPRRRYSHEPLEVWLANFLNRPEIEDLIENVRPHPQADCTDFWGAPYLNSFPGPGEKSFFDVPVGELRLAFMIYHDFFNPLTNKMAGKQKSIGVVMMVCLNLPHEIRYNRENIYTAAVIPGPSEPSREQINHFMRPITQNLKEHYNPGVWISRTSKYPNGRHVRSAALVESMDLLASRAWGGIGPPTHTILCSFCGVHQDEIDIFDKTHPLRDMRDHIHHVQLWMSASDSNEREKIWKTHAARYSEMLCFPWWSPFAVPIAPMHWMKNILEKQLRQNMDWSWTLPAGIPSTPTLERPITQLELDWARAAMSYCTSKGLENAQLTEPILRHLCNKRGIFNTKLPSRRMVKDLNLYRREHGVIDASGELTQRLPPGFAEGRVSLAKAEYYLSKSKKATSLVQKSRVDDLRQLCEKYELPWDGNHHELASRLIDHYSQTSRKPEPEQQVQPEEKCAILGREVMAEIQQDMERTIIPSWMKAPPKEFGRISHGKIGAEEYKSLTLVSLTFTLIRLWANESKEYTDRLDHFLHLTQAIRVLSYQSNSKEDRQAFSHHYWAYLKELKTLYPYCSITPTQHLGLHIPHFLETLGPAPRFNENPSEMFIGMLQDIPMNWRFGELEHTLHKEFVATSNLMALLQQPRIVEAIGEVGEAVQDYLEARQPSHTGVYAKGWNVSHPSKTSILSDEIFKPLVQFFADRQAYPPTRRQFMCTKVQNGHVVYQPESASIGNSQILFEVPEKQGWAAGRIESIILQSEKTDSSHPPQLCFFVRPFKSLKNVDHARDPYASNSVVGTRGSRTAGMFYNEFEPGLPIFIQAKDIVSHIATYEFHDAHQQFSAPCIAVLSMNFKHIRLS